MSAASPTETRHWLDALADRIKTAAPTPAGRLTCAQLRDTFRFAAELNDRGVTEAQLRQVAKVYALRVDELGPEEFDRRALMGA